jgi:ABC-type ATPase involved in cell division
MLNRIEIKGLYGHYTYDLPLRFGQRKDICFLTGPNGYGKSTILYLVYAFLKADIKTLLDIPYDSVVFFLKDYKVMLVQERSEEIVDPNDDSSSSDDDIPIISKLTIVSYASDSGEELERVSFTNLEQDENAKVFPPSLTVYLSSLHVEFIADDRLWPRNADNLGVTSKVMMLQRLLKQYDAHLTALYNMRLLDTIRKHNPAEVKYEELEEEELVKRAEDKLSAFNRIGLATHLTDSETANDDHYLKLMQMIAVDSVLTYEDLLYRRLNLLYDIIERSEFSDKKLVLDTEHGLFFKSDDTIIIPEDLSSGEQHFVIQLITLLIKAEPGSLILIDEPELSYHPAWQMDYLKNLKQIAEIGEFQFILATHSPQIFDYRWGYTIDLYKQTTNDAERTEEGD